MTQMRSLSVALEQVQDMEIDAAVHETVHAITTWAYIACERDIQSQTGQKHSENTVEKTYSGSFFQRIDTLSSRKRKRKSPFLFPPLSPKYATQLMSATKPHIQSLFRNNKQRQQIFGGEDNILWLEHKNEFGRPWISQEQPGNGKPRDKKRGGMPLRPQVFVHGSREYLTRDKQTHLVSLLVAANEGKFLDTETEEACEAECSPAIPVSPEMLLRLGIVPEKEKPPTPLSYNVAWSPDCSCGIKSLGRLKLISQCIGNSEADPWALETESPPSMPPLPKLIPCPIHYLQDQTSESPEAFEITALEHRMLSFHDHCTCEKTMILPRTVYLNNNISANPQIAELHTWHSAPSKVLWLETASGRLESGATLVFSDRQAWVLPQPWETYPNWRPPLPWIWSHTQEFHHLGSLHILAAKRPLSSVIPVMAQVAINTYMCLLANSLGHELQQAGINGRLPVTILTPHLRQSECPAIQQTYEKNLSTYITSLRKTAAKYSINVAESTGTFADLQEDGVLLDRRTYISDLARALHL